jgi:hypothetical protein
MKGGVIDLCTRDFRVIDPVSSNHGPHKLFVLKKGKSHVIDKEKRRNIHRCL